MKEAYIKQTTQLNQIRIYWFLILLNFLKSIFEKRNSRKLIQDYIENQDSFMVFEMLNSTTEANLDKFFINTTNIEKALVDCALDLLYN